MEKREVYNLIEKAFKEGWNSFETPCCAYNVPYTAWEHSDSKYDADNMMKDGGK